MTAIFVCLEIQFLSKKMKLFVAVNSSNQCSYIKETETEREKKLIKRKKQQEKHYGETSSESSAVV